MKKLPLLTLFLSLLCACAPVAMYVDIEMKKESTLQSVVDEDIALFTVSGLADKDSLYAHLIAVGLAEKFEADRGLDSGSVNIYSLFSQERNLSDSSFMDYLSSNINERYFMFIDSLKIGDYIVKRDEKERIYSDGESYHRLNVILPFEMSLNIVDTYSNQLSYHRQHADSVVWSLLGEEKIETIKAVAKANASLGRAFKKYGEEMAAAFSPQWEMQSRMVIVYENERWIEAYRLAGNFEWLKAVDIWMAETSTNNPKKAAYAAYNIANAFEVMEQFDLALKWLDFARMKYDFPEIRELRSLILQHEHKTEKEL